MASGTLSMPLIAVPHSTQKARQKLQKLSVCRISEKLLRFAISSHVPHIRSPKVPPMTTTPASVAAFAPSPLAAAPAAPTPADALADAARIILPHLERGQRIDGPRRSQPRRPLQRQPTHRLMPHESSFPISIAVNASMGRAPRCDKIRLSGVRRRRRLGLEDRLRFLRAAIVGKGACSDARAD